MTKIYTVAIQFILLAVFLEYVAANTGTWTNLRDMRTPRSDHSAITIGDMIVVTGGCIASQICPEGYEYCFCPEITNITEAYLPISDTWIRLADMPTPRYRHALVVMNREIYAIGGRDINDNIIKTIDIYNADADVWTTQGVWVNATSDLSVAAIRNTIYAIGGYDENYSSLRTVWTYDISASVPIWRADQAAPLITGRGDACIVSMNEKLYIYGGFNDINFCSPLASLEVFDPLQNGWSLKADLDVGRGDSACGIANSRVHAIGGERKDSNTGCSKYNIAIDHVERYNIDSNDWEIETNLPKERMRFAAAAYNNTFYVFGGQGPIDTLNTYPLLGSVEAWSHIPSSTTSLSAGLLVVLFVVLF